MPDIEHRRGFAKALRAVRKARGMTQEDFGEVSSRTYVSSLERAEKSPTLDKVTELAGALGIHPLTLLTLTWSDASSGRSVHARVAEEIQRVLDAAER